MRILLVDDDEVLTQVLVRDLSRQRYAVDIAIDGQEAWNFAQAAAYDLIVLDIDLPRLDGISLCKRLRNQGYQGPILLLTAQSGALNTVKGLDAGADDYVVKPCTSEELGARIRALLRRQSTASEPILTWGNLKLDPGNCEVTHAGTLLTLSPKEYSLLELLMRSPSRVFSSGAILDHVWTFETTPSEDTVRAHVKKLRRKLKAVGAADVIETIYGLGYRLKTLDEDSKTPTPAEQSPQAPSQPLTTAQSPSVYQAVAQSWAAFREIVLERVNILQQAAQALEAQQFFPPMQAEARQAAHRLAGSLGMFGIEGGSELARQIENWLLQNPLPQNSVPVIDWISLLVDRVRSFDPSPSSCEPLVSVAADRPIWIALGPDKALIHSTATDRPVISQVGLAALVSRASSQPLPAIVLVDVDTFGHCPATLDSLETIVQSFPEVPVQVFTQMLSRHSSPFTQNSTFLPNLPLPDRLRSEVERLFISQHWQPINILAIDDDPLILQALQHELSVWGLQVIPLPDPKQFLAMLTEVQPDVLLLDVDMPDLDGLELSQTVRTDQTWHGLPIVFLTGCTNPETINAAYRQGADDFLNKPLNVPALVIRIFNRLKRYQQVQQVASTQNNLS